MHLFGRQPALLQLILTHVLAETTTALRLANPVAARLQSADMRANQHTGSLQSSRTRAWPLAQHAWLKVCPDFSAASPPMTYILSFIVTTLLASPTASTRNIDSATEPCQGLPSPTEPTLLQPSLCGHANLMRPSPTEPTLLQPSLCGHANLTRPPAVDSKIGGSALPKALHVAQLKRCRLSPEGFTPPQTARYSWLSNSGGQSTGQCLLPLSQPLVHQAYANSALFFFFE
ncbi:hypothetical protein KP509_07G026800 [Ceratopteris richardii]|uniref:Secreted protein n=1 Tax=Ceratopteris richardii TaxID=49495 RepID=A0A8T2U9K1_CERRI|nr:hypothetical protein KP509_07G026800 [Ceratopteris richardii]